MTVHALRETLTLVPEAIELCKQASVEDGFPTNNADSTLSSALKISYMTKVANEKVPYEDRQKVALAVSLYGLQEKVAELSHTLSLRHIEKQAAERDLREEVAVAESVIESEAYGFVNLEKVASMAIELYDTYEEDITSPVVRRYACADVFVKEAAVRALECRAKVAPNRGFDKIASIVAASDVDKLTKEDVRNIAHCVSHLDKVAGLSMDGYNFYSEAFITKEAACSSLMVKLDSSNVPVENILKAPIGSILGDDVAKEIGADPYNAKTVIEALPLDMQRLLLQRVR